MFAKASGADDLIHSDMEYTRRTNTTRFILGRAGSGKTHYLHEQLVQTVQSDPLGTSVILIVPKQATFTAEQAIATDPRLGGFINVRVIAPDDLGELALVESGASGGAKLDAAGRGLILSHLLREHADELQHFNKSATQPGMAAEIDATFSEFERAGRDLCEIKDLIDTAQSSQDSSQQSLARKLTDLCRLYTLYQQYLKDHDFDAYNRQTQAIEAIEKCPLFQRSLVLIDDFYDFTAYERLLITRVVGVAKKSLIAMMLNPASPIINNPHHRTDEGHILSLPEQTYRKLYTDLSKSGIHIEKPLLLTDTPRFNSAELSAIERGQLEDEIGAVASTGSVVRIVASDFTDEVDAAARQIQALLSQGHRLRDIAVLARSIETYESLIDSSFSEHGIAFFTDKRREATHHPLVRTLLAVCAVVKSKWSHDSVLEMLRAGLTPTIIADVDLLDDYIRQHNVSQHHWSKDDPWTFHRPVDDEEQYTRSQFTETEINRVNALRVEIRKALSDVGSAAWSGAKKTIRDRIADLFQVLDRFHARQQLLQMIAAAEKENRIQDRDEHLQVWTRVTEMSDQMVSLLGEVETTGVEFAQMFQQILRELDLAITPPTIDQVLVGSIERTRVRGAKAVILLGMNADQFPKTITEKAVLNDRDRYALNESGVEVRPASRQTLLQERFLGYLALTRASERLIMLRTASDANGNPLEASPFWKQIDRYVADVQTCSTAGAIDRIATPRQAISNALVWARMSDQTQATDDIAGLYNWIATTPTDAVQRVRDRAWPVLRYENKAALSDDIAKQLYTSKLQASVSRFESFAACPFQHFARYGLRLQRPADPDVTAMDLGNLYHSVLERLIRKAIEEKINFATTDQLSPEQIRAIAIAVGEQLRHQVFMSNAQNQYTVERLENAVYRLIQAQQFTASLGVFEPAFTELAFGKDAKIPALTVKTPDGNQVELSGKIDRVDLSLSGKQYLVIDYKLAGESLSLEYVAHGLMLQMLTYLLVLEQHGQKLAGQKLTPAAALYVRLLRSIESVTDPAEAPVPETPEFHAKNAPRGIINAKFADDLDASFSSTSESLIYCMKKKKDGTLSASGSDAVDTEQFEALIAFVYDKIGELADQIIAGNIDISPYLIGNESPCPRCDFKRVCRFDHLINGYKVLEKMSRTQALEMITNPGGQT